VRDEPTFFDVHYIPHNKTKPSIEAARGVMSRSKADEARLLIYIQDAGQYGRTDQEIAAHFGWQGDYVRPRRWTLLKEGKIKERIHDNHSWYREIEGKRFTVYVIV